jgi:hypothetical protein
VNRNFRLTLFSQASAQLSLINSSVAQVDKNPLQPDECGPIFGGQPDIHQKELINCCRYFLVCSVFYVIWANLLIFRRNLAAGSYHQPFYDPNMTLLLQI